MAFVLPILESKIHLLISGLRFIVFFLLVIGLIVHMSRRHVSTSDIVRPVARAIVIVAMIASAAWWFPLVENTFLAVADYVEPDYNSNPLSMANTIRESITQNPEGKEWSWRKLNSSIYHAMVDSLSWLFIQISCLMTAPMIILQYILRWLLYLMMPFALACFMIPGCAGMGVRFIQQTLAILAWPVGFALTNLVATAVWEDFSTAVGTEITSDTALYMAFLTSTGAIIGALILIIGTLSTPVVCQMLFARGYAFTGDSATPAALGRSTSDILSRAHMISYMSGSGSPQGGITPMALASSQQQQPPPAATGVPGL